MKFRALLTDGQQIHSFIRILQSFGKFSQNILLRLSENEIQLLNDFPQTSSPFVVRCILKYDDYFEEYVFRGVNSVDNFICFRLRSDSLSHVLSSLLPHIKALKLKLRKDFMGSTNDSVLSIAVNYPTNSDTYREVCHKIKIGIISSEEWNEMCEQDFHSFDLSLYLPDSRVMGATTERLSDSCNQIEFNAKRVDNKALLYIIVETDSISIKSKFSNLDLNEDIDSEENTSNLIGVRIDVRKMNLLFNTLKHLKPTSIISNISDKKRISFQFFHNSVNFQAFLPNIEF